MKTGVQTLGNYLNILDSGFRGNDKKGRSPSFYDFIIININRKTSKLHNYSIELIVY